MGHCAKVCREAAARRTCRFPQPSRHHGPPSLAPAWPAPHLQISLFLRDAPSSAKWLPKCTSPKICACQGWLRCEFVMEGEGTRGSARGGEAVGRPPRRAPIATRAVASACLYAAHPHPHQHPQVHAAVRHPRTHLREVALDPLQRGLLDAVLARGDHHEVAAAPQARQAVVRACMGGRGGGRRREGEGRAPERSRGPALAGRRLSAARPQAALPRTPCAARTAGAARKRSRQAQRAHPEWFQCPSQSGDCQRTRAPGCCCDPASTTTPAAAAAARRAAWAVGRGGRAAAGGEGWGARGRSAVAGCA